LIFEIIKISAPEIDQKTHLQATHQIGVALMDLANLGMRHGKSD